MAFRFLGLILGSILLNGCAAKIIVTRVPIGGADKPMEGIYYALPKTVIKVDQPIDRVSQQPGKYSVYLPVFFPKIASAAPAIRVAKASFKVNKATISAYGEPDPEQTFYVKLTNNGPIDRTGLFEYTELGTVSGVSAQADNATSDIVLSVLNTAAGLGAKALGAGTLTDEKLDECSKRKIPHMILHASSPAGTTIDQQHLLATYCGLPDKVKDTLDNAANEKKPDFNEALSAYAEIFSMQTDRATLRKSPQSLSLDVALKDFDTAIAASLGENFIGVEKKDTWTYSTELRDFKNVENKITLLRVHETEGLCFDVDLPGGDLPPKSFWLGSVSYHCDEGTIKAALVKEQEELKKEGTPNQDAINRLEKKIEGLHETLSKAKTLEASFALNPANDQQFQILAKAAKDAESGERGFFYRIPASVDVLLKLDTDTITKSKQVIAQFGITASLPASTGGKSTAYALKFYEATGALKSFNITSKAVLGKGTADALGTDITTLVAAKQAAEQAQKTKNDELTGLDRQAKILADKKAIYDNCKALNMACGGFVPLPGPPE